MEKEKTAEILTAYGLSKYQVEREIKRRTSGGYGDYIIFDYDDLITNFDEYFPKKDFEDTVLYENEKKDFLQGKGNIFQLETVNVNGKKYVVHFIG